MFAFFCVVLEFSLVKFSLRYNSITSADNDTSASYTPHSGFFHKEFNVVITIVDVLEEVSRMHLFDDGAKFSFLTRSYLLWKKEA